MEEIVRYNYRLRPGKQAEKALLAEWDRCRWLWNEAVHMQISGQRPNFKELSKMLTELRSKHSWFSNGSQVTQQQMLRLYDQAFSRKFKVKGTGWPKFKKKNVAKISLEYSKEFSIKENKLKLSKVNSIPMVLHREMPSKPSSVRVYQDNLGHWYASFVVRREVETLPEKNNSIGIDWGISQPANTTNKDYDLYYAGHRKRCQAEVAKAQRKMSRRFKKGKNQSKGYQESKRQSAKLQKKAARQNKHDANVWAKDVVANNQLIAIEDFKPKFLSKSTMAKKASDIALGQLKTILVEKATRAGRQVFLINPRHTTMTCSQCFSRATKKLELSQRIFNCEHCGLSLGRDLNAARVILAVAELNHISVEDVSREMGIKPPLWRNPSLEDLS